MADAKYKYKDYVESDAVKQAQAALNAQLQNKPGAYQSQWQSNLDDILNRIQNREKFTYDINGDALYQQYKDKFMTQGKLAMQDTMGQAAAMTGGYGNSYAASVGNQAYQTSLQGLNNVIPELYNLAYEQYKQQGQDLYNQYALLGEREAQDYSRYRDTVSDWNNERNYLAGRYDSERSYDYGKYTDDRNFDYGVWTDNRNYEYQKERDRIADEQWQKNFDEAKRQYEATMAFNKAQAARSSRSGSGSGSGKKSTGMSDADRLKYMEQLEAAIDSGNQQLAAYYANALIEGGADSKYVDELMEKAFRNSKPSVVDTTVKASGSKSGGGAPNSRPRMYLN